MLDIVSNNPYRVLGVYSNSPIKDRVENLSKIKAFLKVGKPISFPMDLPSLFPELARTENMVSDAESKLALSTDQFRYAQFWFINSTANDEIALNCLIEGDIDNAVSIWKKEENVSSLQNRIVCYLISDSIPEAIACAEKLYGLHKKDFISAVMLGTPVDASNVEYDFLDRLCYELGTDKTLPFTSNINWRKHISNNMANPLIDVLRDAINISQERNRGNAQECYNAGTKLMGDTKCPIDRLKAYLGESDLRYQMIVDDVGLEILQCGIDYFNGTHDLDAPKKAMELQAYAMSIVIGEMAKERCKENFDILQGIISNLPPEIVREEVMTIEKELQKYKNSTRRISDSISLLNRAKTHLQTIRAKLGKADPRYLRLSTDVVYYALMDIVEYVNSMQRIGHYESYKEAVLKAQEATLIMDDFDVEDSFRDHYMENRSVLQQLRKQIRGQDVKRAFEVIIPIIILLTLIFIRLLSR